MTNKLVLYHEINTGKQVPVLAVDLGDGSYGLAMVAGANVVSPADQASTNAYADVTGSTLNALNHQTVAYTAVNDGAATITWQVLGANKSDFSDAQVVKAGADIAAAGKDTYTVTPAPYAYYKVQIKSKVADTPGAALVSGVAKG